LAGGLEENIAEKLTPLNQLRRTKNTLTHEESQGNHHREGKARKPPPPGEKPCSQVVLLLSLSLSLFVIIL